MSSAKRAPLRLPLLALAATAALLWLSGVLDRADHALYDAKRARRASARATAAADLPGAVPEGVPGPRAAASACSR